ncbi:aldehyde dehydrogenase family protein [Blastococcus saxobsidens]|uniref:Succinate-semialdehyde dehydrogenase/glutarate-semialdehyde dehydrogenase n=1 Tax=Blastococcus saxobsidens TaxID=138336 RepID=A0A4Q7Y4J8_9ACTN|nr:aldehyde dehydrogenase family protein [Blastococcus saxobsidens]RZU30993.1 succinate-semialdehyde dehydrogenase/glutarate-semialdehyde dehydrogenase [Blastococcus saxobsidens]
MVKKARLFYGGTWADGESTTEMRDKYSGQPVAEVHQASTAQVTEALEGVARGQERHLLTPYERYEVLYRTAGILQSRYDEFVETVILDAGFTLADARREADRAVQTLVISGEEAKRIHGEVVPWGAAPGASQDRYAFTVRRPLGVVCAITPFNSPLNTLVHKVAPALAAGNSVIVKPATYTPLSAGLLVEALLEAGLPEDLVAVVTGGGGTVGQALLESPVPAFYAFTGSTEVGEHIQRTVGLRKTQLEMGSLSSTLVCDDADIAKAARLSVYAGFRKAGQVCTSVQRLYVQTGVLPEFVQALQDVLATQTAGDPRDEKTLVGPVISEKDADRIESWITRAVDSGASVLAGGKRQQQVIEPTVLSDVTLDMDVLCKEIFGPVLSIRPFSDLDEAITEINDTPYGLSAGIFTADIGRALSATEKLRMGSVHVNETSSNRVDLMPYGGVKRSGMGIEGPKYAIEEMTEHRLITLARP